MIIMSLQSRVNTVAQILCHTIVRMVLRNLFVCLPAVLSWILVLHLRSRFSAAKNSCTECLAMVRFSVKSITVASPLGVPSGLVNRINITVSVPALELTFPVNQPVNGDLRLILVIINRKIDVWLFRIVDSFQPLLSKDQQISAVTFNGEVLDSSQTYQSLGIKDGSVITVVISKGV